MRILVVLAHPRRDSFNGAVAAALLDGLREAGHDPDMADLYAEGFRPALTEADMAAFSSGSAPADVTGYQERVRRAEGLAFVFPIWWFSMPAAMKGFFDRVFFEGFAFRFLPDGRVEGLLRHSRALVLNTAGASALQYEAFGFQKPLERLLDDWTLRLCGVGQVRHVVFHGLAAADEGTRRGYLAEARRLGAESFGRAGASPPTGS